MTIDLIISILRRFSQMCLW